MKYENWEKKVRKSTEDLKIKLDKNPKCKELYNGFYIWDSKYIENPEIMFIGINPGDGNPNNDRSITTEPSWQMSYLEYMDGENPTYTLARENIRIFELLGYSEDAIRDIFNNQSVKTNLHYVITKTENDMINCFNILEENGYQKYKDVSLEWTYELIKCLNPKIIICEGKGVFDKLANNQQNIYWDSDCGYFQKDNSTVIGYSRRMSSIRNKEGVVNLISGFWKNGE